MDAAKSQSRPVPLFGFSALIIILLLSALVISATADQGSADPVAPVRVSLFESLFAPANSAGDLVVADYFYSDSCPHCAHIKPFLVNYTRSHPDVRLEYHGITNNQSNREMFHRFQNAYAIDRIYVPVVFLGDRYLLGNEEIEEDFDSSVSLLRTNRSAGQAWSSLRTRLITNQSSMDQAPSPDPALFVTAALGEGVNPCGLVVLVLFLASVMGMRSRISACMAGIAFILAFYLTRCISGLAVISFLISYEITRICILGAGVIAIGVGLIQIRDGLSHNPAPFFSIPGSGKRIIGDTLKKAGIPAAIAGGILIGLYGMGCTGGIYLTILSLISSSPGFGVVALLLYNLLVILPMAGILLLVTVGIPPERINAWREERKNLLRLCIGVIMVILGLSVIVQEGLM